MANRGVCTVRDLNLCKVMKGSLYVKPKKNDMILYEVRHGKKGGKKGGKKKSQWFDSGELYYDGMPVKTTVVDDTEADDEKVFHEIEKLVDVSVTETEPGLKAVCFSSRFMMDLTNTERKYAKAYVRFQLGEDIVPVMRDYFTQQQFDVYGIDRIARDIRKLMHCPRAEFPLSVSGK